jgi:hypothetical protein
MRKAVMICVAFILVTALACVSGIELGAACYPSAKSLQFQSYSGPFIGSRNSNVYHYPWCPHVQQIKPENRVTFNTVADACAAGYRPCEDCNPPPCGSGLAVTPTPVGSAIASASFLSPF